MNMLIFPIRDLHLDMQNKQLCFVGQVSSSRRLNGIKRSGGRWGESQPATFQKCKTGSLRPEAAEGGIIFRVKEMK